MIRGYYRLRCIIVRGGDRDLAAGPPMRDSLAGLVSLRATRHEDRSACAPLGVMTSVPASVLTAEMSSPLRLF